MNIITTFFNCLILGTFKYWTILLNEFPYEITRRKEKYSSFHYSSVIECRITIGSHKGVEKNTVLLHEIGHFISYCNVKADDKIKRFKKYGLQCIKREEKQAWKYALRLSKQYDIDMV